MSDGLFFSQRTTLLKMASGGKHVRESLRKTGDGGCLVLREVSVVNPSVLQALPKK